MDSSLSIGVLKVIDLTQQNSYEIGDLESIAKSQINLIVDNTIVLHDAERFVNDLKEINISSVTIRAANAEGNNLKGLTLLIEWIIKQNLNLAELQLEGNGNSFSDEGWLNIFLALLNNSKGKIVRLKIDLTGSPISNETLKSISECLTGMNQVEKLELLLGKNIICKGKHIGRFFKAVYTKSEMKNLSELVIDVQGIHLGHANSRDVIELAILNATTLKEVKMVLAGCSIQKKGMEALKKLISQMKLAKRILIDISGNALVDEFFKDFFRAFWILPTETPLVSLELNLYENYFAAQTTDSLSEGFKSFAALKNLEQLSLVLGKNSMNDQLASQIIKGITNLLNLKSFILDLSNSRERIEDLLYLDDHLKKVGENLACFSINVKGNPVSEGNLQSTIDSIEAIVAPLSLKEISLTTDVPSSSLSVKLPSLRIVNNL